MILSTGYRESHLPITDTLIKDIGNKMLAIQGYLTMKSYTMKYKLHVYLTMKYAIYNL